MWGVLRGFAAAKGGQQRGEEGVFGEVVVSGCGRGPWDNHSREKGWGWARAFKTGACKTGGRGGASRPRRRASRDGAAQRPGGATEHDLRNGDGGSGMGGGVQGVEEKRTMGDAHGGVKGRAKTGGGGRGQGQKKGKTGTGAAARGTWGGRRGRDKGKRVQRQRGCGTRRGRRAPGAGNTVLKRCTRGRGRPASAARGAHGGWRVARVLALGRPPRSQWDNRNWRRREGLPSRLVWQGGRGRGVERSAQEEVMRNGGVVARGDGAARAAEPATLKNPCARAEAPRDGRWWEREARRESVRDQNAGGDKRERERNKNRRGETGRESSPDAMAG